MKPIVHIPNPVLFAPAKKVTNFDKKLDSIIKEMKETLIKTTRPKGVGLAAPQVDIPYQIFLTRPTSESEIRVFINPEIIDYGQLIKKTDEKHLEGCLSVPHIWGTVNRYETVKLRFQDGKGAFHEETFEGFLATIIQHESDHLNGILFTRRVIEQKGSLYQDAKDEEGKDVLEKIQLT